MSWFKIESKGWTRVESTSSNESQKIGQYEIQWLSQWGSIHKIRTYLSSRITK